MDKDAMTPMQTSEFLIDHDYSRVVDQDFVKSIAKPFSAT